MNKNDEMSKLAESVNEAKRAIDEFQVSVDKLRRQSEQIAAPAFALKFKDDYYNWDKALLKHATKTDALSIDEQIEWWQNNMKQYSYNYYAVMECEEEIYKLNKKLVKQYEENARELADKSNDIALAYIEERNRLNDWESFSDDAISAFSRVKAQNEDYLNSGIISYDEYTKTVSELGEDMYNDRQRQSRQWLEQQYKYNKMSEDDYIAGLERMAQYTNDYYSEGMISYISYLDAMKNIGNDISDMTDIKNQKTYSQWQKSASGYRKQRNVYGDWDEFEDDEVSFYARCIERQKEFFAAGIINWETYNNAVTEYSMEHYKAQYNQYKSILEDILAEQKSYIENIQNQKQDEINELEYEWKMYKYDSDISNAAKMISVYRNAVTQKGKDQYEKYYNSAQSLIREEEIYKKKYESDKLITQLKRGYEEQKSSMGDVLNEIMKGKTDISHVISEIGDTVFGESSDIKDLLERILAALGDKNAKTVYGNTTYNITGMESGALEGFIRRATMVLDGSMN